jgi:hypothetical protein
MGDGAPLVPPKSACVSLNGSCSGATGSLIARKEARYPLDRIPRFRTARGVFTPCSISCFAISWSIDGPPGITR